MRLYFGRSVVAATAFLAGPLFLTGCGSSGGVGNTATARLRAVDASPNAGTVDITANGGLIYGDLGYFSISGNSGQNVTPYQYIGPQNSVPFTFTYSETPVVNSAGTNNINLSQDQYYTAFMIGRADIASPPTTTPPTPADPRFLQVVVPAPRTTPTVGLATLRVLNAAPDAGFTPGVALAAATVGSINVAVGAPATNFTGVAYASTSGYQTVSPGNGVAVTATLPGGTVVTSGPLNLSANAVYTLVVVEKTIPVGAAPAAYELRLLSE